MQCIRRLALTLALLATGAYGQAGAPDVFLITVDTLRADRVTGQRAVATRGFGRLATDGVVFTQAFTSAPLTNTAHASILTGLLPAAHGVHDFGVPLSRDITTLAEVLKQRGYRTAAFIGALVLDSKSLAPGLDQGFDTYFNFPAGKKDGARWGRLERRAADVVAEAERWLAENPAGPRFVWVHLYDPHDPYEPPEPYASEYRGREYDGEVAYADAMLAGFLEFLSAKGWYENALVIATGDHGEGLGEHGEDTHGILLYDSTLHVPLVIKLPRAQHKGSTVERLVRNVDLFATVAEAAGATVPSAGDGHSLAPLWTGADAGARDLIAETQYPLRFGWAPLHGLRTETHKLIEAPRAELYDLRADPGEGRNVYEPWSEEVRRLRSALRRYRESVPRPTSGEAKVPQSTIEELKALGYLGSDPGATEVPEPSLLPDPKDKIAVHNALHSAMMQEAAGDEAAALASLQRALALEPDSFPGRSQAGMLESRAGNHAAAAAHLKRAHALRPKDAAVAFALGDALFAMQDFRGARDALAAALQLDARRYDARVKLGEAERALGNIAAAVSQFEAAALLDPARTEAEVALARLYLAQGESAKASALLRRAARRAPHDEAIAALLAEAERSKK